MGACAHRLHCPTTLQARTALANLRAAVDTLIVIPNDRLLTGAAATRRAVRGAVHTCTFKRGYILHHVLVGTTERAFGRVGGAWVDMDICAGLGCSAPG